MILSVILPKPKSFRQSSPAVAAMCALALAGCLGGEGQPDVDASPEADAAVTDGAPQLTACQIAMQEAPTGGAAIPFDDALATATVNTWDGVTVPAIDDPTYPGGKYRTLAPDGNGDIHPGCSTVGLAYTAASITNYACAAKEYPFPAGTDEDTSKPIVLLMHGNSDGPDGWEQFLHPDPGSLGPWADTEIRDQLAELLPAAGYRTYAVDYRIDLVDDPTADATTGNPARNIDHGWAVPIAQEFIKRVIEENPDRMVSIIGFSLGGTVVRDALRRLFVEYQNGDWDVNVFGRVHDAVLASGAHHGVSTGALCGANTTMRGTITCEMGQRNAYTQTGFHTPLGGPEYNAADGNTGYWYESPCADGSYAFGLTDACDGNTVQYTTITMSDLEDGTQQDLFTSEYASRLYPGDCVNNVINGLNDFDTSGYFENGLFRNHYGAVRSQASLTNIMQVLAD